MRGKVGKAFSVIILITLASASMAGDGAGAGVFDFSAHWRQPIPPQGSPPEGFSEIEKSLRPEDCGQCHADQLHDWSQSRHAASMGAGVTGQLSPPWLDEESIESCLDCHAPLSEQRKYARNHDGEYIKNPIAQKKLPSKGLTCAGCHVRRHVRYGPTPNKPLDANLPHGGFVEVENFGAAEFCKPCHQFENDGRRVAGKLLEDTYEQWRSSEYSKKGVKCADCHMPGRRHLWKGIHDPETVKAGVAVNASLRGATATVTVGNKGVGHYFPTYVTPQVVVRAIYSSNGKSEIVGEKWIGWNVSLDLEDELYDTRIPPGQTARYEFHLERKSGPGTLEIVVIVYPDEFYGRLYKSLLDAPPKGINPPLIKKAYRESGKSRYTLFKKIWRLP
jgi:hypothetical protein